MSCYFKPIGDAKILEKKAPSSVCYKEVRSSLDTGKVKKKDESADSKLFKKVENFKRMKGTELMKLILLKLNSQNNISQIEPMDQAPASPGGSKSLYSSMAYSTFSEAKLAVHQTSPILVKTRLKEDVHDVDNMVLLLDVRDPDEYAVCHIQTAYRYPAATVNRTVNPFTPEMLSFKNHPLKKIVIYDRDEKVACPAANLLFEKGFDNIVVLSGGLQEFFQKHPDLIVGQVPKEWYPPVPKKKTRPPSSVASLNSTKKTSITKEKTKSTGPKPFK